jgi:hypothetical protein
MGGLMEDKLELYMPNLVVSLTRQEVAYIRAEMLPRFGSEPRLSDGLILKTWKSGPLSGSPRLPSAVSSLIERGLAEVRRPSPREPSRAYFTALGIASIAAEIKDKRVFPPNRYSHLIGELFGSSNQSIE